MTDTTTDKIRVQCKRKDVIGTTKFWKEINDLYEQGYKFVDKGTMKDAPRFYPFLSVTLEKVDAKAVAEQKAAEQKALRLADEAAKAKADAEQKVIDDAKAEEDAAKEAKEAEEKAAATKASEEKIAKAAQEIADSKGNPKKASKKSKSKTKG